MLFVMSKSSKVYVVASTGGSVLRHCLESRSVQQSISAVISDRQCGALDVAVDHQIRAINFNETSAIAFSDMLLDFFSREKPDLVVLFYTKILKGRLIDALYGKIVNFHPSLLPSFAGQNGFEDSIDFGSKYIGSTAHLVVHDVDMGFPVQQFIFPNNPSFPLVKRRHIVFLSQCAMLTQLVDWVDCGRFRVLPLDGRPYITDCFYDDFCFSPRLECSKALMFYNQLLQIF